ncbi:MAG: BlaI/MecI/CopY family transcriptional regulator [Pirellulales bacterium]|nr:BlaI/MecI/CopY family transcriptional regulator [Pirellulales bacterium]
MKLSGRQLAIMRVLWEHGEASVADVQSLLDVERPLAYSTVATVLSRMEQKGLVTHRCEDRVYYYRPAISKDGAGQSMVGELVERVFGGRPSELVNHLLDSEQVDSKELQRIKKLVREYDNRNRKPRGGRS